MFDEEARRKIYHDHIALELPVILLDRGDCTFVTKVRNVEKAGANVAIIGDNKAESSEVFIMSDDGSGHSINIPSFLIRKDAADAFKDTYESGRPIVIKVEIETVQVNSTAHVDFWYSSPFDVSIN